MRPVFGDRAQALAVVAFAGVGVLLLGGCSSGPSVAKARDLSTDVPFTACTPTVCSGSIGGAAYKIDMPQKWNGTLLIYSHGYRYAEPVPPKFAPVDTSATDASDPVTAQTLLSQGFALAGSAYKSNGWAVADGVAAAEGLFAHFSDSVGQPNRVLVWGDSLGGLITEVIAEKHPEWVDGAAPLCGALAGVVPNMNLALDVSYAVKALIDPQLKLTGYASYQEAVQNWSHAMSRVIAAAADTAGGGSATVLYIADLVDVASQTKTFDGATVQSRVKAIVEALATALGYATFARYDLEQRFGGNPSGNDKTDYSARISDTEAALIDAVTPGAVVANDALMAAGHRVSADPAALAKALADGGDPQGRITRPEITMHTAADPLAIVQNEKLLAGALLGPGEEGRCHCTARAALHGRADDLPGEPRCALRRRTLQLHAAVQRRRHRPAQRLGAEGSLPERGGDREGHGRPERLRRRLAARAVAGHRRLSRSPWARRFAHTPTPQSAVATMVTAAAICAGASCAIVRTATASTRTAPQTATAASRSRAARRLNSSRYATASAVPARPNTHDRVAIDVYAGPMSRGSSQGPATANPSVTARPSATTARVPDRSVRRSPSARRGKTTTATTCGSQNAILRTTAPAAYAPAAAAVSVYRASSRSDEVNTNMASSACVMCHVSRRTPGRSGRTLAAAAPRAGARPPMRRTRRCTRRRGSRSRIA